MSCIRGVPIKLGTFNSVDTPCANSFASSSLAALNASSFDTATASFAAGVDASYIAYLGAKCVKIACAPVIAINDSPAALVSFLDANLTGYTPAGTETIGDFTNETLSKYGIAKAIAGCDSCCVCS